MLLGIVGNSPGNMGDPGLTSRVADKEKEPRAKSLLLYGRAEIFPEAFIVLATWEAREGQPSVPLKWIHPMEGCTNHSLDVRELSELACREDLIY